MSPELWTMIMRTMVKWNNDNEWECHGVCDGVCLEYVTEKDRVIDSVGGCMEYWLDRVCPEYVTPSNILRYYQAYKFKIPKFLVFKEFSCCYKEFILWIEPMFRKYPSSLLVDKEQAEVVRKNSYGLYTEEGYAYESSTCQRWGYVEAAVMKRMQW